MFGIKVGTRIFLETFGEVGNNGGRVVRVFVEALRGQTAFACNHNLCVEDDVEPDVSVASVLVSIGVCYKSDGPPELPGSIESSINSEISCPLRFLFWMRLYSEPIRER